MLLAPGAPNPKSTLSISGSGLYAVNPATAPTALTGARQIF